MSLVITCDLRDEAGMAQVGVAAEQRKLKDPPVNRHRDNCFLKKEYRLCQIPESMGKFKKTSGSEPAAASSSASCLEKALAPLSVG